MRIRTLPVLTIVAALGLPFAALADTSKTATATQPTAPTVAPQQKWDDSHMRSNHWARDTGPVTRPAIQGASGYGAMEAGTATPTKLRVDKTLSHTTQREWEQGPLRRAPRAPAQAASTPPTSPRGASSGINRGSSIRANSVSTRR